MIYVLLYLRWEVLGQLLGSFLSGLVKIVGAQQTHLALGSLGGYRYDSIAVARMYSNILISSARAWA